MQIYMLIKLDLSFVRSKTTRICDLLQNKDINVIYYDYYKLYIIHR